MEIYVFADRSLPCLYLPRMEPLGLSQQTALQPSELT